MRCLVTNAEMILMRLTGTTQCSPWLRRRTFMCSNAMIRAALCLRKNAREGETAPPIAGNKATTSLFWQAKRCEPMPLEGEPEPVQVAPPIAGEQDDNEPMPREGGPEPAQVRHLLPASKAIMSLCLRRANLSLCKWRHPPRASKTIISLCLWRANPSLCRWRHLLRASKAITSLCLWKANRRRCKWRHPLQASKWLRAMQGSDEPNLRKWHHPLLTTHQTRNG
jgi:hypothetical protein